MPAAISSRHLGHLSKNRQWCTLPGLPDGSRGLTRSRSQRRSFIKLAFTSRRSGFSTAFQGGPIFV
jgi:hypothetical protein